jgi:hypothetical protein
MYGGGGYRHYGHRRGYGYSGFAFGYYDPYAYGAYPYYYEDIPPDCYIRRVRVHHHWVYRRYCY